jgi:hypothetical protein
MKLLVIAVMLACVFIGRGTRPTEPRIAEVTEHISRRAA